jgi:membrane protein required for beta-lactamase induction
VMTWLQPAVCIMLAMSLALMGARERSFLSWRAIHFVQYGDMERPPEVLTVC